MLWEYSNNNNSCKQTGGLLGIMGPQNNRSVASVQLTAAEKVDRTSNSAQMGEDKSTNTTGAPPCLIHHQVTQCQTNTHHRYGLPKNWRPQDPVVLIFPCILAGVWPGMASSS